MFFIICFASSNMIVALKFGPTKVFCLLVYIKQTTTLAKYQPLLLQYAAKLSSEEIGEIEGCYEYMQNEIVRHRGLFVG